MSAASAQLVVFQIEDRRLALTSDSVLELVRAVAVTALPGAPIGVDGVIDRRGTLVPVFDLRPRLALPSVPVRASEQFIICEVALVGTIALRTDRVLELRADCDLAALPAGSSSDPIARSLLRLPDGVVVVCDLGAVLTSGEIEQLARALDALTRQA